MSSPLVLAMYEHLFEGRDPVAEPGTADGTRGDWWTVVANSPAVMQHAVDGFLLYQSPDRALDPVLREVAQLRVGVAASSRFVAEQHSLALGRLEVDPELVEAVADPERRPRDGAAAEVVDLVDAMVAGLGTVPDEVFEPVRERLGDEATLELCYITTMYLMHAVLSKLLETESDDPGAA